jgi:DNA-binding transcriptional MerR regulator
MSDQSPAAGAMPTPVYVPDTGATPSPGQTGGATPPEPSLGAGATPSPAPASDDRDRRDADSDAERDESGRDAELSPDDLRQALSASRQEARRTARELKRLQDAERKRLDAEKSELERTVERAEAAEARASALERQIAAQQVATEFGIGQWVDELQSDKDVRAMREHARRIQERLRGQSPGMDGGVRSLGVPDQSNAFEDQIRAAGRR